MLVIGQGVMLKIQGEWVGWGRVWWGDTEHELPEGNRSVYDGLILLLTETRIEKFVF